MLPSIAHQLEVMRLRLEGHDVCENCGCEMEESDIVEGEDGELLCEACADEIERECVSSLLRTPGA